MSFPSIIKQSGPFSELICRGLVNEAPFPKLHKSILSRKFHSEYADRAPIITLSYSSLFISRAPLTEQPRRSFIVFPYIINPFMPFSELTSKGLVNIVHFTY